MSRVSVAQRASIGYIEVSHQTQRVLGNVLVDALQHGFRQVQVEFVVEGRVRCVLHGRLLSPSLLQYQHSIAQYAARPPPNVLHFSKDQSSRSGARILSDRTAPRMYDPHMYLCAYIYIYMHTHTHLLRTLSILVGLTRTLTRTDSSAGCCSKVCRRTTVSVLGTLPRLELRGP